MVTARDETVVGHRREWKVGVGVGGVGGTIRLWRTALFYGGSRSREYQVGIAWVACLAPSVSTNQQKHIHYREARTPICPLPPTPLVILGIMACLGRACWETPPHFGLHSAINRSNRLVYSTQIGQPFKLPEESRTICGRNKRNTRPPCGFRFSKDPPYLVQHYL